MNQSTSRNLALNALWNLLGTGLPLLVAIVAIPILIDNMGPPRFGVLTLAWMIVGYFSLFDLGLGRALTKLIAERIGKGNTDEIPPLVWTAMMMMVVLGVVGAIIIAVITPSLVGNILNIPKNLQPETRVAFYLLAASIPIVICTTGLRGILEAYQRFGLVNAIRLPLGIFTFLGPLAVLPFSYNLIPSVSTLVVVRMVAFGAHIILCFSAVPSLRKKRYLHKSMVRPLLRFGGWMTVTNIVGPLMVYLDRFVIASIVSMEAVAYYATPNEVVTRLAIIPNALMGVLFPAFVTALASDKVYAAQLFGRSINYVFLALFPFVLIIITFANEGMTLWLGEEFAVHSVKVLQLLALGVLINSMAKFPLGLIQGAGRPDLTAKLHLIELPFYLLLLWWLLNKYGIEGAAAAWLIRVAVDTAILFIMAHRILSTKNTITWQSIMVIGLIFLVFILGSLITGLLIKIVFVSLVLLFFFLLSWYFLLTKDERALARNIWKKSSKMINIRY